MPRTTASLATAITFGFILALLGLVGILQATQYASVPREGGNSLDLEVYSAPNTMNKDFHHEQTPANHHESTASLPLPDTGPGCYQDHPFYLVISSPKSPHLETLSLWDIPTPPYGLTDARVSIFDVEVS